MSTGRSIQSGRKQIEDTPMILEIFFQVVLHEASRAHNITDTPPFAYLSTRPWLYQYQAVVWWLIVSIGHNHLYYIYLFIHIQFVLICSKIYRFFEVEVWIINWVMNIMIADYFCHQWTACKNCIDEQTITPVCNNQFSSAAKRIPDKSFQT